MHIDRQTLVAIALLAIGLDISRRLMTSNDLNSNIVIVVGGGLAGLSAAAQALQEADQSGSATQPGSAGSQVRVLLVDKSEGVGGNSAKATSGMNGAETQRQIEAGIADDSIELFTKDIERSGAGRSTPALAHLLAVNSASAVSFLERILGSPLSSVAILGGHSKPRTHRLGLSSGRGPRPIGWLATSALKKYLNSTEFEGQIEIREKTELVDIKLSEDKRSVFSVTFHDLKTNKQEVLKHPKSVVMTSGGFGADLNNLIKLYGSSLSKGYPFTTNGDFATGDLLKICLKLGLATIDLDWVQLHPTSFVDPKNPTSPQKFLCPELFRGVGGLMVNALGHRFVNEISTRDVVSKAILENGSKLSTFLSNVPEDDNNIPKGALLLMNDYVRQLAGPPFFDFYCQRGFISTFKSGLKELPASYPHVDVVALRKTLELYNESIQRKAEADSQDRANRPTPFNIEETLHVAIVTPAVHYTIGGVKTNADGQVMFPDGLTVTNLFAAGELSGGLHGANRLGGNGMLESVVFGRVTGRNAALMGSQQASHSEKKLLRLREVCGAECTLVSNDLSAKLPYGKVKLTLTNQTGPFIEKNKASNTQEEDQPSTQFPSFEVTAQLNTNNPASLTFEVLPSAAKVLRGMQPGALVKAEWM